MELILHQLFWTWRYRRLRVCHIVLPWILRVRGFEVRVADRRRYNIHGFHVKHDICGIFCGSGFRCISIVLRKKGDWVKCVIPYRTAVWFASVCVVPNEYCCGGTWWSSSEALAAVVFVIKFAVIVTVVVGPGLVRGIHKQWGTRRRVVLFRWWRRRPLLVAVAVVVAMVAIVAE